MDNPERYAANQQRFYEMNPGIRCVYTAARNAGKDLRTPKWLTEDDLLHIKCLYQVAAMRTRESGYEWHVDHVVPLHGKNVSGLHVPNNLRVIPASENCRKSNKWEVTI